MAPQQFELFDPTLDARHRSYRISVGGEDLPVLRPRVADDLLMLDAHWIPRLRAVGLLSLCRLVEADNHVQGDPWGVTRFTYDRGLLTALVDKWRPEAHTFHLPCGEVAPTLQDVSFLLGLPCAGAAVGARNVSPLWKAQFEARFAGVERKPHLSPLRPMSVKEKHGPTKAFLAQFTVQTLHPLAGEESVTRTLEAYLLTLFGWVMFTESHDNSLTKSMIPYAQEIADAVEGGVQQYNWALAVLAATYRGLCDACTRCDANSLITGCPLLLQLWSYERFAIGRPLFDLTSYAPPMDAVDGPTMGSIWCRRQPIWAPSRRSMPTRTLSCSSTS